MRKPLSSILKNPQIDPNTLMQDTPVLDLLTQDGLQPFLWAIGAVLGLLVLEVLLHLVGLTSEIGGDADADAGLDADGGPDTAGSWAPDAHHDTEATEGQASTGGPLDLLGLRGVPLAVWFAFLAAMFASVGLGLQMAVHAVTGGLMAAKLASLLAAPPAVLLTSKLARFIARILPRETTAVISERSFGRRFGDVTEGVARLGHPAQVRFTDQHGNLHYLMAEPLDPAAEFRKGSRVLILRTPDGHYRLAGAE